MRMMSIASGSSGNCIYIGSDNTHILIDAGVSRKKITEGLKMADLSMSDISAIFVTHEHIDHTKGIGVISRKDHTKVYSTQGTIDGIFETTSLRSEEHTSELQSPTFISYAVFCLKKRFF